METTACSKNQATNGRALQAVAQRFLPYCWFFLPTRLRISGAKPAQAALPRAVTARPAAPTRRAGAQTCCGACARWRSWGCSPTARWACRGSPSLHTSGAQPRAPPRPHAASLPAPIPALPLPAGRPPARPSRWNEALHGVAISPGVTFAFPTPAATSFPQARGRPPSLASTPRRLAPRALACRCRSLRPRSQPLVPACRQVIGTSSSFNETLWAAVGGAIATEARAFSNAGRSGLTFWTPNMNIFRDPRRAPSNLESRIRIPNPGPRRLRAAPPRPGRAAR